MQTPEQFLQIVKSIVELDDLSDYQKISQKLALEVKVMSEQDTYISQQEGRGKLINIEVVKIENQIWDQQPKDFSIGIFQPEGKLFQKIWFRGKLRPEKMCITRDAIFKRFGYPIRESIATDLGPVTSFFDFRKKNWITLEAHFHRAVNSNNERCVIKIGFSQNIHGTQE